MEFDTATATASPIRDEDEYGGIRVGLTGKLATARLNLHIDVNVGDPIWPRPQPITLPRLLGGELHLTGYPLPMILAEKIITAIQRGTANTRWRDFADIYTLAHRHTIPGNDRQSALTAVAEYRHVELAPLQQVLDGYVPIAQPRWTAWRRRTHLDDHHDARRPCTAQRGPPPSLGSICPRLDATCGQRDSQLIARPSPTAHMAKRSAARMTRPLSDVADATTGHRSQDA